MNSNPRYVYVDTQYLHAYLFSNNDKLTDDEYIAKTQFNYILHNKDPNLILKIPFIVVGEVVNNIHRKSLSNNDKSDIIRLLLNMMDGKVDFVPPTVKAIELANHLLNEDRGLDNTDTLIVAQAICDPQSTHFIVKDSSVVESPAIQEVNKDYVEGKLRDRLLKITPEFKRGV